MIIGSCSGRLCKISTDSPNRSVCITGLSGTGKTSRLNRMEMAGVDDGATVVVLDINKTHTSEQIFSPIRQPYTEKLNYIDVMEDGLGFELLRAIKTKDGKEESFVSLVNSAIEALSASQRLGAKQAGVLRRAVIYAIRHLEEYDSEAEALQDGLRLEDDETTAQAVQEKLWTLLHCGALKKTEKHVETGKINVLDLSEINMAARVILAEIILANIWRQVSFVGTGTDHQLFIVVDEFQNLSCRKNSVLMSMLREGRKFGLQLLLATQTLDVFPREILAILRQTATQLYFRPAPNEVRKIARDIAPEHVGEMAERLLRLKIGQAIAVGDLCVEGREIRRPLMVE